MPIPYFGGTYVKSTFKFVGQRHNLIGNVVVRMAKQELEAKLKDDPGFRDNLFADNPITGQPSCPIGFESVLLFASNITLYAKEKFSSGLEYERVWVCYFGRLNSF